MVDIARRNLFQEKLRFMISSGGVALAIMLILILNGFYTGLDRQVNAYLDNTPIDIVVARQGLRNFVGANSLVPLADRKKIEDVEGVRKVIPVFVSYAVLEIKSRKVFALLIGFDPKVGGGPWQMLEGRSEIKNNEMVYDETAAIRNHLKIGDKLTVPGQDLKIVGLSGGTSTFMTGTAFITFEQAALLRQTSGTSGYFLVAAERDVDTTSLRKRIARVVPNLSVVDKTTMAKNDVALFAGVFSGPLLLMVIIAFFIGILLVGLTVYTATVERSKEYGVLKAIGMKNKKLYLVVFEQAIISSILGFALGVGLSFVLVSMISRSAPQFLILIEAGFIARLFPVAVLISLLASYLPIRVIAKLDPAIAFSKGA